MRDRSILLWLSVLAAFGCGADKPPPLGDMVGPGGGTPTGFCGTYCATVVANGNNCQHYNDGSHCVQVCEWYRATVCTDAYSAFASCVQGSTKASCYQASSGKWGLNIPAECADVANAWQKCVNDKNVGYCPYGN
jgi:hypothetical protein